LEETVELSSKPIFDQKVCAVDLGINTDAVCSVLDVRGTVLARKFIRRAREKDQVMKALHRVSVFQRLHGSHDSGRLWSAAKRRNENLANHVAHDIVEFAAENSCDVIVFEYLRMKGKKHGSKKQRLAMWKHRDIQKTAESLGHKYGMRISRVCPWNTSGLAYDGSGKTKRGKKVSEETPYDVCVFTTGKVYNVDLSASYNIGARYFIRELIRELALMEVPDIMAEVPDIGSGTRRTLSHLWKLNHVMDVL
jgi:IS605 OrfB family transposase